MAPQAHSLQEKRTSLEAYFEFEFHSERKHEFVDGRISAMAYTSEEHGRIVSNLTRLLGNCLLDKNCDVFASDRMLFIPACNQVFYPDLLIVCGTHEFYQASKNMKATLNPMVVIEILSDSTEYMDKTTKTRCYKKIPGLQQILFVSQKEQHIRILTLEGEKWIDTEFYEEGDVLHIGACSVPLTEIYRRVAFQP
jgi:Uma2 family endonuclease